VSPAVPQTVLEQPAFHDAALYTADALGNVMLEVGATVSTTIETDAVPDERQLRRAAVTR
jgi:hypothetical protein